MKKDLSLSKILVVGLARDCGTKLESEIHIINSAFSESASVSWLVIESDSNDNTLEKLNELSANNNFDFISLGNLRSKFPKRTERIAKCRNRYIEEIRFNSKFDDIDYVVIADLDGVNSKLTSMGVSSCWHLAEEWDACFANQPEAYYDIWALRHKIWSPNDCWKNRDFLIEHGKSKNDATNAAVYSRMIKIKEDMPPIEVESAFGGLGIYKKSVVLSSEYVGLNSSGDECCEHISFHETMNAKGLKLIIVPSLVNCGWTEHSKNLTFIGKLNSMVRQFAIRIVLKLISKETLTKIYRA